MRLLDFLRNGTICRIKLIFLKINFGLSDQVFV